VKQRINIFFLVLVLAQSSCRPKGIKSYLDWYEQIPPYTFSNDSLKMSIKEYPKELGWIYFFGNKKLNSKLLDTMYQTPDENLQFIFISEDTLSNTIETNAAKFNRFKFSIEGTTLVDVRPVSSGDKKEKYLIVFKRTPELENLNLTITGPNMFSINIPINKIIIKDKRKLRI
jgi:hypothetical protein